MWWNFPILTTTSNTKTQIFYIKNPKHTKNLKCYVYNFKQKYYSVLYMCVCVKTEVNVWEVLTQKYISGFHGIKGYVSKNVLFHIKTNNPSANAVYSGKKCIPIKYMCSLFCFVLFCCGHIDHSCQIWVMKFPIFCRIASLALGQLYDWPINNWKGIHGCVLSTVDTDSLVLKHQAIGIHSAD